MYVLPLARDNVLVNLCVLCLWVFLCLWSSGDPDKP